MTNEFFLHPLTSTTAARVPFPADLPLADRDAYMTTPPADVLAVSPLVLIPTGDVPPAPVPPAPVDPDTLEG